MGPSVRIGEANRNGYIGCNHFNIKFQMEMQWSLEAQESQLFLLRFASFFFELFLHVPDKIVTGFHMLFFTSLTDHNIKDAIQS